METTAIAIAATVESIRIILLVLMLGIAGLLDFKTRKIPDVLWLVFGGMGAILYLWDHDALSPYHYITMILGGSASLMVWRWRIAGVADSFAIVSMTVILPVHYEFVMMPIIILVLSFVIVVFATVLYNIVLNLLDIIKQKKRLFSEFPNEPTHRKLFAFVSSHRKRKHETFVIPIEKSWSITPNIRSFRFLSHYRNKVTRKSNQLSLPLQPSKMMTYVQNIPPLTTFMFGVAVFLLLPEIISMISFY